MSDKPLTILYVEDTISWHRIYERAFKREFPQLKFLVAEDFEGGIEQLKNNAVDLLISDMGLPHNGMMFEHSGMSLIRQVISNYPSIRCLAVTSVVTSHVRDFGMQYSIPVADKTEANEVLAAVHRALNSPPPSGGAAPEGQKAQHQ